MEQVHVHATLRWRTETEPLVTPSDPCQCLTPNREVVTTPHIPWQSPAAELASDDRDARRNRERPRSDGVERQDTPRDAVEIDAISHPRRDHLQPACVRKTVVVEHGDDRVTRPGEPHVLGDAEPARLVPLIQDR